ncbi:hypothetical protein J6590_055742 [Homalodisca vitripennis]|nr:hypothetical protein J6590_055742 [Homalodisca vitripennis]
MEPTNRGRTIIDDDAARSWPGRLLTAVKKELTRTVYNCLAFCAHIKLPTVCTKTSHQTRLPPICEAAAASYIWSTLLLRPRRVGGTHHRSQYGSVGMKQSYYPKMLSNSQVQLSDTSSITARSIGGLRCCNSRRNTNLVGLKNNGRMAVGDSTVVSLVGQQCGDCLEIRGHPCAICAKACRDVKSRVALLQGHLNGSPPATPDSDPTIFPIRIDYPRPRIRSGAWSGREDGVRHGMLAVPDKPDCRQTIHDAGHLPCQHRTHSLSVLSPFPGLDCQLGQTTPAPTAPQIPHC